MSKYLDHSERISSYLDGHMTKGEMLEFEKQLHTDPVLRSEFELQQDIIHTLKDFRKAELKTRLDQVPVSMGPSGLMGIKAAAAIVISGIIGLGAYLYFTTGSEESTTISESLEPVAQTEIAEVPQENVIVPQTETTDEATFESVESTEIVPEETIASEEDHSASTKTLNNEEPTGVATVEENEEEAEIEEKPVINSPNLIEPNFEESDLEESIEMPSAALAQEGLLDNNVVAVETARKDSDLFHYQYYSGKLYLYGDFRDNPYEILELNSVNGKRLFIYYNNEYYRIKDNQKEITALEVLTDQDTIKKLEIIQANK